MTTWWLNGENVPEGEAPPAAPMPEIPTGNATAPTASVAAIPSGYAVKFTFQFLFENFQKFCFNFKFEFFLNFFQIISISNLNFF